MIPRILHRVVPENVPEEYENYWRTARELHPDWDLRTWQDPIDPEGFESAHLWPHVESGAQLAGLIRLEVLWKFGGIYLDMDVEPIRSLEPLLQTSGFACWEDGRVIPDAVLGFEAGHSAIRECLDRALAMDPGEGAWATGPGITTAVLKSRSDVLTLPPASFYPYYYTEPERAAENFGLTPWVYGVHRWHGSWRKPKKPLSARRALRTSRRMLRRIVVNRSPRWSRADELRDLSLDPLAETLEVAGTLATGQLAQRWAEISADVAPASLDLATVEVLDADVDSTTMTELLLGIRQSLHVGGSVSVVLPADSEDRAARGAREALIANWMTAARLRHVQPVRAAALGVNAVPDGEVVAVAAIR